MKVGVLQFFSWPGRRVPLPVVYERALDRIRIMDQTGYDAVWLAEHHFNDFSVCPSVHLMGTHVAAITQNLRIGTAVSLAAFYHPLRLAEEVALLDVLSGGRVNWGAGRGFDAVEFKAFQVSREESYPRFREAVEVVLRAWREERLTFHGEFFSFDDVEVLPKPVQQPHPPSWIGVTSAGAIDWAAERGYSILMDPHCSFEELAQKRARYFRGLAAHGHSASGRELPTARLLAVADSDREAEEVARRGAQWMVGAYANDSRGNLASPAPDREPGSYDPVDRYIEEVVIHGSPARVLDRIETLRSEASLDYLMCAPLSHQSFLRFTEKVLPQLL
jgi:alkanesulfonate monooxygenase SsuD/methylene tetrahydromethanopterin reductase-like flavin-dependent oxidoreductase (luciferase family)